MARIVCGISNIPFKCDHVPMVLQNREYNHPIFSLPQKKLLGLYSVYNKGELSEIDSYLLFLALLNSTDSVEFVTPAIITESTISIIARNIDELVHTIWESNAILAPRFKQPCFYIRSDTASLDNISTWIAAWRRNIDEFKLGLYSQTQHELLIQTEKKLTRLIFTPEAGQLHLSAAVAEWADRAASFPKNKADDWKAIIRKCYNLEAMFSTPKVLLVEIKCYCEENIESGSIQFHTLMKTLRAGIDNHNNFLGLGSYDTFNKKSLGADFTLLSDEVSLQATSILSIIASAPTREPIEAEYPNKLAFIKARLAYRSKCKFDAVSIPLQPASVSTEL